MPHKIINECFLNGALQQLNVSRPTLKQKNKTKYQNEFYFLNSSTVYASLLLVPRQTIKCISNWSKQEVREMLFHMNLLTTV